VGRVSVAVHSAGLDLVRLTRKVAEVMSSTADEPAALIEEVLDRGRPLVSFVDALDEAVSQRYCAQPTSPARPQALQPLSTNTACFIETLSHRIQYLLCFR
jgi:hypothetical protein